MKRPVSELIGEAENRLRDTRSRIEEQQRIIARRTAIGADVTQSMTLLENLEAIALLRERRLRYLREWRP